MAKMRIFKFWNEAGDEKEKESMSESLDGIAQIEKLQHKTRCKF